jgi:indole-3-glycerol phosphate synthase
MTNTLEKIITHTRDSLPARKEAVPLAVLKEQIAEQKPPRGFVEAILVHYAQRGFGLITEIKKASPSFGVIREDFDPATHAAEYAAGGASCLSVLTEEAFFQGSVEHLQAARAACSLPVLRKDFIVDPYQVYETRAMGADCILLIMAALTLEQAEELQEIAFSVGLDVLVEVHDEAEMEQALKLTTYAKVPSHFRADFFGENIRPYDRTITLITQPRAIIGINNRNLKTLTTDLATSERLSKMLPEHTLWVSESGIYTRNEVVRLQQAGAGCFLIGESLMRQESLSAAVGALLPQA